MSMRSRLERLELLERAQPASVSILDVICGARDMADLDDTRKAILQQMLADADAAAARDPIEEKITAALARPVGTPPSTCSAVPSPTNHGNGGD